MSSVIRIGAVVIGLLAVLGCTSLPSDRGYRQTGELVESRLGTQVVWPWTSAAAAGSTALIPDQPISVDQAVRLALERNPRVREVYARLGVGRAELEEARRIANPTFAYTELDAQRATGSQITRVLSLSLTDILLLSARRRFAEGELERLQSSAAADLVDFVAEVEVAWYDNVSAGQVAAMREIVAKAAEQSAELAQRFFDAGNIHRLQLERELAAAAQARIDAVRAAADVLRTRSALATLLGLPLGAPWRTVEQLPAPPLVASDADSMVKLALDQRLDLVAARREVVLLEDALGVTRRWRWLGSVEVGYERETEIDDIVLRGPSLSVELPIFNQGQGAIARARAELDAARARLDALALAVNNDASLGLERLNVTREIAERYRTALVPRREAIVARSQEQVNFMLIGVFELIAAKQDEYDAYQEYLEAVRDYWVTRADLRRLVGGRLPDDSSAFEPVIGVESILPSPDSTAAPHHRHMDHQEHEHGDRP